MVSYCYSLSPVIYILPQFNVYVLSSLQRITQALLPRTIHFGANYAHFTIPAHCE